MPKTLDEITAIWKNLSYPDQNVVRNIFVELGGMDTIDETRRALFEEALIKGGFMPDHPPKFSMEEGASEYEDAMRGEELMR